MEDELPPHGELLMWREDEDGTEIPADDDDLLPVCEYTSSPHHNLISRDISDRLLVFFSPLDRPGHLGVQPGC